MTTETDAPSGIGPHHILLQAKLRGIPAPNPEGFLAYYKSHEAYYAYSWKTTANCDAEIMISLSSPDGGTFGEFSIQFGQFDQNNGLAGTPWMRLQVYEDALQVLVHQVEFFTALAALCKADEFQRAHTPTPAEVEDLLKALGYTDKTRYVPNQSED